MMAHVGPCLAGFPKQPRTTYPGRVSPILSWVCLQQPTIRHFSIDFSEASPIKTIPELGLFPQMILVGAKLTVKAY